MAEDFSQDINIEVTNGHILLAEIKEVTPDNLDVKLLDIGMGLVTISPLLLNSKDQITIKLLIKSPKDEVFNKEDLKVKARIAGILDVTKVKTKVPRELYFIVLGMGITVILSLIMWGYMIFGKNEWIKKNIIMGSETYNLWFLGITTVLFTVAFVLLLKRIVTNKF